jgi:uncharacterized protein YuzE
VVDEHVPPPEDAVRAVPKPEVPPMNVKYFQETGTLYIELGKGEIAESRDVDEDTLLDVEAAGNICAITIEHPSDRADIPNFSFEQVAA